MIRDTRFFKCTLHDELVETNIVTGLFMISS